jgi:2-alkyl-3-oxoalkanoate reductase
MQESRPGLFIMGATGFVGKQVVQEALARGFRVKALVRNAATATELADGGATLIPGDAGSPEAWIGEAAKSRVLIDLVQPELPARIGLRAIRKVAAVRLANMRKLLAALQEIPSPERPLLLSVSGLDDLLPDAAGRVGDDSPLRDQPVGFGHIGIPVRRLIEQSGIAAAFIYLGTVYGPGKTFAAKIFPQVAAGNLRIPGSGNNRMPLVHVQDAARALAHAAALPIQQVSGFAFVVADGSGVTMRGFLGSAAELLGAPAPRTSPLWMARAVLGSILCETLTRDIGVDPARLVRSGFTFRYPSPAEGLPPTLQRLGLQRPAARGLHATTPQRRSWFWAVSAAAIGSLVAENLLNFPLSVPAMERLAGGLPLLDMRLGYSAEAVYRLFAALGGSGRSAYLHLLWTVDLCLPLLFALFLSGAIRRGRFRRLQWMPALAAGADYAENLAITVLLLRYPDRAPALVLLSAALTCLKQVGYFTSLLVAGIGYVLRKKTLAESSHTAVSGAGLAMPAA